MAEAVKVSIRVRPFNQREQTHGSTVAVQCAGATVNVLSPTLRSFTYDQCFWSVDPDAVEYATQEFVSSTVGSSLVEQALNGFNGCVFAYGQTGSGKSYSVFGDRGAPGFIPWTVEKIFKEKRRLDQETFKELRVWVSYLEIYNEHLHDLLQANMHGRREDVDKDNLKIHDHPKLGVYVPGLTEVPCGSNKDVIKLLDFGAKKRAVAATQMNEHSSRSHAVVILKVQMLTGPKPQQGEKDARRELHAKLNLIDLAGSERQSRAHSEGDQFREACAINKSLSALGLVIKELSEEQQSPKLRSRTIDLGPGGNALGSSGRARALSAAGASLGSSYHTTHSVPFRASKLTFLLKDSLAGNSKTHMLAAISPASDSIDETVSTLRFASSVKEIKTVATQNLHTRDGMIDSLRNELEMLRAQLSADSQDKKDQVNENERLIAEMMKGYEAQLEQANEMERMREEALKDMALSHSEIASLFQVPTMTPYLLNMSDDPTLAGRLLFYIPCGQKRDIGSAKDNAICLSGIGITERLCVIENIDNTALTISKSGPEGRVVVAGIPLEEGKPIQLRHGQRIFLGRAFAMKVCIPAGDFSEETSPPLSPGLPRPPEGQDINDLLLEGLEDEWASIEHSPSWCNLSDLLNHYAEQMPPDQANALWNEVKRAVMACDEANDITSECRPEEGLKFEVDLTSALRMSVVVRVLREGPNDECQQLYIWSVGQMIERLDRMKDCYNTYKRTQEFSVDPLYDPWHEARPATIWHRITDLEKDHIAALLVINRLRGREQNLVAKTLLLMQDGFGVHSLKVIFHSWVQVKKGKRRMTRMLQKPIMDDDALESEDEAAENDAKGQRETPLATRCLRQTLSRTAEQTLSRHSTLSEEALVSESVFVDSPAKETDRIDAVVEKMQQTVMKNEKPEGDSLKPVLKEPKRREDAIRDVSVHDHDAKLSLMYAFKDLRNELIEQRREAGRLKTNRTLLCNSIDRFEYGVERLLNAIEQPQRDFDPSSTTWEELLAKLEQSNQNPRVVTGWADVPIPTRQASPFPTRQPSLRCNTHQSPILAHRTVLVQPPALPMAQARPVPVCLSGSYYSPQVAAPVVHVPTTSSLPSAINMPVQTLATNTPMQAVRLLTPPQTLASPVDSNRGSHVFPPPPGPPTASPLPSAVNMPVQTLATNAPMQAVRLLTPPQTLASPVGSNRGSHVFPPGPPRSLSQSSLPLESLATVTLSPRPMVVSRPSSPIGSPMMPSSPRLSGVNGAQTNSQRPLTLPFSALAKSALATKIFSAQESHLNLGSAKMGSTTTSPRSTARQLSSNLGQRAHRRSQPDLRGRSAPSN